MYNQIRISCSGSSQVSAFHLFIVPRYCKFPFQNSGSMEPAFQRGDILFLTNRDDPIRAGEIVVFKIKDRDIPIVHRVMKVHEKEDGKVNWDW